MIDQMGAPSPTWKSGSLADVVGWVYGQSGQTCQWLRLRQQHARAALQGITPGTLRERLACLTIQNDPNEQTSMYSDSHFNDKLGRVFPNDIRGYTRSEFPYAAIKLERWPISNQCGFC